VYGDPNIDLGVETMWKPLTVLAAATLLVIPRGDVVAQPSELNTCVTRQDPDCGPDPTDVYDSCGQRFFREYTGRVAWFPLQYVSPITIEIEGRFSLGAGFPIYVEIVPLTGVPPASFCFDGHPGYVVGIFRGGAQQCGGGWEQFGPVPLDAYVQLGGLYALQLTGFSTLDQVHSPAIDCVHVFTGNAAPSAVLQRSWAKVRVLYK